MNATGMYANHKLAKELFELSGWEGDFHLQSDMPQHYSLGYLLRKLPAAIDNEPLILCTDGTGVLEEVYWCAYYDGSPVKYKTTYDDDTPEDAACSLAIELWKTGVLK